MKFFVIEGEMFGEILVKQLDGPSENRRGSNHLAIRVKRSGTCY